MAKTPKIKRKKVNIATLSELKEFIVQVAPKKGSVAIRAKLDRDEGLVRLFFKPVDHLEVVLRPDLDGEVGEDAFEDIMLRGRVREKLTVGDLIDAMLSASEGRNQIEEVAIAANALMRDNTVRALRVSRMEGLLSKDYYRIMEVVSHGDFQKFDPILVPANLVINIEDELSNPNYREDEEED